VSLPEILYGTTFFTCVRDLDFRDTGLPHQTAKYQPKQSSHGIAVTANAIKLIFSRLSAKSGVYRLHAHLCRHTFAINYLLNGGDIFSLKEILGHSTLEMVNHYLHFTRAQITEQHRKYSPMDRMFNNK